MKWFAILIAMISLAFSIYLWVKANKDIKEFDKIQQRLENWIETWKK